jgi:hypothetical protein
MTSKHLVVGIDWYGPFTLDEARQKAKAYGQGGLYICVGKLKGQHHRRIQYVGKSNHGLYSRLQKDHHKLSLVSRQRLLWAGVIATGNVPGKKKLLTPQALQLAEWAIAKFMELPLNGKLRKSPPPRPVSVLSRWWKTDLDSPRYQRPHPEWPDLIDYLGPEYRTRLVWFGSPGRQRVIHPNDITRATTTAG